MRDVTTAGLSANTASERIRLTRQFIEQAGQALELAQTRYGLGLIWIVELSQAQFTKTNAWHPVRIRKIRLPITQAVLEDQTGGFLTVVRNAQKNPQPDDLK